MNPFQSLSRPHTRIKLCGLTRMEDVRLAGELGVDAIGLVFAPQSPRRLDIPVARRLREAAPASLAVVALVMDQPIDEVRKIIDFVRPDVLQFHGSEDDMACRHFGMPFLKAIPMRGVEAGQVPAMLAGYPSAEGFVFDAHAPGAPGGTGERFDWDLLTRRIVGRPWLLAGGLTPSSVGDAVRRLQPWGVDVSSGIERVTGIKDAARTRDFVEAVRAADRERPPAVSSGADETYSPAENEQFPREHDEQS